MDPAKEQCRDGVMAGSFSHDILRCDGAGVGYVWECNGATALGRRDEACEIIRSLVQPITP
jgi:hypothetical protein